jgi:hypothetical protein
MTVYVFTAPASNKGRKIVTSAVICLCVVLLLQTVCQAGRYSVLQTRQFSVLVFILRKLVVKQ